MVDIVVTWPKTKPLAAYLEALREATERGAEINYRVSRRPHWDFDWLAERRARCYRVHDGAVRGYTEILYVTDRGPGEVKDVGSGNYWPAGTYIVCLPRWHPLKRPVSMQGFRGWRWCEPYEQEFLT